VEAGKLISNPFCLFIFLTIFERIGKMVYNLVLRGMGRKGLFKRGKDSGLG